jgi:hypothetical protein
MMKFLEPLMAKLTQLMGLLAFSRFQAAADRLLAEEAAQHLADAERHEKSGAKPVAEFLRQRTVLLSLNIKAQAAEQDAGVQYLLGGPAEPVMPTLPALPSANGGHEEPYGPGLDHSLTRTPPPVRRGPGRPPRNPALPEPPTNPPQP